MREILFRGKRTDNGEWVYGVLFKEYSTFYRTYFWTIQHINKFKIPIANYHILIETVGQYTGLTDKNGKKIFEGDIVKTNKFNEPNKKYIIKYNLQFGAFIGEDKYHMYFTTFDGDSDQFEVIGNIHDNPELLEVSDA